MDLQQTLESTLTGLGYELVDFERSGKGKLLRVYIDKTGGINVDDCAAVSNHLSRLFAVEGIDYDRLEISSPGLDRRLRHEADYRRFAGRLAKVVTTEPIGGQSAFAGRIRAVERGEVLLEEGRKTHRVSVSRIKRGHLVVEF